MRNIWANIPGGVINCLKGLLVVGIGLAAAWACTHGLNWLERRFIRPSAEFRTPRKGDGVGGPDSNRSPVTADSTTQLQKKAQNLRELIAFFRESARTNRSFAMQWSLEASRPGTGLFDERAKAAECLADALRDEQQANRHQAELQAIEAELARRK